MLSCFQHQAALKHLGFTIHVTEAFSIILSAKYFYMISLKLSFLWGHLYLHLLVVAFQYCASWKQHFKPVRVLVKCLMHPKMHRLYNVSLLWDIEHFYQLASCQIRKTVRAHAPGIPGTFSPPARVSDPDMHHGTCVTHVPWCMPGSLTN